MGGQALRHLVVVPDPDPGPEPVPPSVQQHAQAGGWPTCDVCAWPVDPAVLEPGRTPRHPGCVCGVCSAPLVSPRPGDLRHPQCGSGMVWTGRARRAGRRR